MNPPSLSLRDARPADRPPPRDPQAAGKPQSTTASKAGGADTPAADAEAAFKELVEEARAKEAQGDKATNPLPEHAPDDATKTAQDDKAAAQENADKKSGETATLTPVLAQPQPLVPPTPRPARDQAPARETTRDPKNSVSATLSSVDGAAKKEAGSLQDAKENKAPMAAKPHPDAFATLLQDTQKPNEVAPIPAQPMVTRSAEPLPPAPPTPPTPPLPIVALPATIAIKALEGSNQFQIRLDPEDLGRIDVSLEIKSDGSIRAAIAADNPDALQLIVREARSLEQAFDQAGFRRDDQALSFSLSDQQQSPDQRQSKTPQQNQHVTRFFVEGEAELPAVLATYQKMATGRLDVRI